MPRLTIISRQEKNFSNFTFKTNVVAEPWFHRRGGIPEFGVKPYYLARFLPKTAWNERNWRPRVGGGHETLSPPWIRQCHGLKLIWCPFKLQNFYSISWTAGAWNRATPVEDPVSPQSCREVTGCYYDCRSWRQETRGFNGKKARRLMASYTRNHQGNPRSES